MGTKAEAGTVEESIEIGAGKVKLPGDLTIPEGASGLVVFVHGSGSSRFSSRNRWVAQVLARAGLGTLLMDLLTPEEELENERTGRLRFDIPMLAGRVIATLQWLADDRRTEGMRFGCFGASTGGGAALIAAAESPDLVSAVVSRGGRPDLAGAHLIDVRAPTLLIVGSADPVVLRLNQDAYRQLRCEKRLEVVQGATHLFEEPGTLDSVARLAQGWFLTHLAQPVLPEDKRP